MSSQPAARGGATLPPLVMHLLFRFDTGGLENGVVNLINRMPSRAFRHMVVALTEVTAFRERLADSSVLCVGLHKPPGHGARVYGKLWKLLRQHRPAIVHTRNLAALEMQPVAWAAGVPARIHGEHGRDVDDPDGNSRHHQRVRRLYAPFVQRYTTVSADLQRYLVQRVGIAASRTQAICNGVDNQRFVPMAQPVPLPGCPWPGDAAQPLWCVGTVGRLQAVKNQVLLARAFARALALKPAMRSDARLLIVGEGGQRPLIETALAEAGVADLAWLAGERSDVPAAMQSFDVFVLPSLAEGISNTILEAMASALPVLASGVGGNAELVQPGVTGELFPNNDVEALAALLVQHHGQRERSRAMGQAGVAAVAQRFSLAAMVGRYQALYESMLPGHPGRPR